MKESKREYLKRINAVLDFIEENLDGDLSLERLAEKAHYSIYHFHRVFLTVVNERLNAYINRKRIERIAAVLLVKPQASIKDLAYQYGFNSDNSFSRAFRKYYGISPTQFKTEGKELLSKIGIEPFSSEKYICSMNTIKKWTNMNAEITLKELSELKMATISQIGDFDKTGSLFQKLMQWGHQHDVLDMANFNAVTIYHDNPNVTELAKVRFSAGVTISKAIKADGEIRQHNLKEGIYAVGRFEIKGEEIPKAWKSMCVWVVENGYEFRDGDYYEMYHNDHKTHPEQKFILDIGIPLEKTTNLKLDSANKVTHSSAHQLDYHQLIGYMKELRLFFQREYETLFRLGAIYKGNPDYSYFSLTTEELKQHKLKFVIILNHKELQFDICLSGQNKSVRKKYWKLFKESDWGKYHIVASIDNSLMIIDHTLVEQADFSDSITLNRIIEAAAMEFMDEIRGLLEE